MALSPEHRRKLVGLLGQLGHDNENVRASAGLAADKLVRAAGDTWETVVAIQAVQPFAPQAPHAPPNRKASETVGGTYSQEEFARILARALQGASTEWEFKFVSGLRDKFATYGARTFLSSKQKAILERLAGGGGDE